MAIEEDLLSVADGEGVYIPSARGFDFAGDGLTDGKGELFGHNIPEFEGIGSDVIAITIDDEAITPALAEGEGAEIAEVIIACAWDIDVKFVSDLPGKIAILRLAIEEDLLSVADGEGIFCGCAGGGDFTHDGLPNGNRRRFEMGSGVERARRPAQCGKNEQCQANHKPAPDARKRKSRGRCRSLHDGFSTPG